MKLTLILFAFFFNFFTPFFIKSEEIIDSSNRKAENTFNRESSINDKSDFKKIHIVRIGDTITTISKLYSIDKDLIIRLNNLKDENYIFIGQNLKISDNNKIIKTNAAQNIYHLVQKGENLTEISIKYGLGLKYLIEINKLKDKDSIKVGSKIFLRENNLINQENIAMDEGFKKLTTTNDKTYGPITIKQNKLEEIRDRKILNAVNQNNKNVIISVRCETKDLDVRFPGRKWRGWLLAKEDFEINLINDFC